jgi:hypothetical protein
MEIIVEFVIEAIGELILQIVTEVLFEFGFYSLAEVFNRKKERNPALAFAGYALWGAIIGGASLFIFPDSFIRIKSYKVLNLIVTPVLAGMVMASIGKWRLKKGQRVMRIDRFGYGAVIL